MMKMAEGNYWDGYTHSDCFMIWTSKAYGE